MEKAYAQAFDLYSAEKYEESKALIQSALEKYPKDALVPKFALLNAFNTGKTAGKEIMILQLEQIALNYARTLEGEKAEEMLKYLKSELEIETTDDSGNKIDNRPPASPVPPADLDAPPVRKPMDGSAPPRPGRSPGEAKKITAS